MFKRNKKHPSDERLSKVAEFRNALEAHSVRIMLEANGIVAIVLGDTIKETGLEPIWVCVHQNDYEIACTIIREVPAASEVLIPLWNCECGEEVDAGFHLCWACGKHHPSTEI